MVGSDDETFGYVATLLAHAIERGEADLYWPIIARAIDEAA